jgi:hypothetical protein
MVHRLIGGWVLFVAASWTHGQTLDSVFDAYITKDGVQSFRFVAKDTLPSYHAGQDIRAVHETQISNELGKRQYCLKGYEILVLRPCRAAC